MHRGVASRLHVQAIQGELAAVGGVGAGGAAGVGAVGGGRVFGGVGVGLSETERERERVYGDRYRWIT